MHVLNFGLIWWILGICSMVGAGSLNQRANVDSWTNKEAHLKQKYTNIKVMHSDHSVEIHRLRQENERLRMENNQFQRIQETVSPLPHNSVLQNRGHQDLQDPPDQLRFLEPEFTPQSVHLEVTKLKQKLEQNQAVLQQTQTLLQQTQAELRLNQRNYNRCQKELEQMQVKMMKNTSNPRQVKDVLSKFTPMKKEITTSNNQIMVKEEATCKDQKPKKVCKKLKEKNKGKGCKKVSTKKKCKKTCGLCEDSLEDKPLLFQGGVLVDLIFDSTEISGKKTSALDNKKKKDIEKVLRDQFCNLDAKPDDNNCAIQTLGYRVTKRISCGYT